MRIFLAQINPTIGDIQGNLDKILHAIDLATQQKADLVLFPEMALTGYPPEDFLLLPHFMDALNGPLRMIQEVSKGLTIIVGTPRKVEQYLYNSAAIFSDGKLLGYQDKTLLPTYDVFTERRYFEPATTQKLWKIKGKKVAVTICEDLWQHSAQLKDASYQNDPVLDLQKLHPDLLVNLSASPFSLSKIPVRLKVCKKAAQTLHCPVVLCNQVGGNDGLIFDGSSIAVDQNGNLLKMAKSFAEDLLLVDLEANHPKLHFEKGSTELIYNALVLGLRDYFQKSGFEKACLGLSGGIDSAVVACIASEALGPQNVLGVIMPSRYSLNASMQDAVQLAKNLTMKQRIISVEQPFQSYLDLLTPEFEGKAPDATEENLQARIRGMILMALSNKHGYIVLSTGNKSELAMGYATLYGDMCGGLGVINDLTKRQVYALAHYINRTKEIIPKGTIERPPSAELRPDQKDSDTLPDYEIVDNIVEAYVEEHLSPDQISKKFDYPRRLVDDLIRRIHCNEYKRRQSPPGLRVTEKAFTIGRRFPIVQRWV